MFTVVCMKWGKIFSHTHVNALFAAVKKQMPAPFRFVCLTDDNAGIAREIVTLPIPDMNLPEKAWRKGCWPKLSIFKPGLFPGTEAVLFLDLDLMIQGSLMPFIHSVRKDGGLFSQREWNPCLWSILPLSLRPDRGVQSAVLGFIPEETAYIYETFVADPVSAMKIAKDDQSYLTKAVLDRRYWPSRLCVSFKRSCVPLFPFRLLCPEIRRPRKANIIIFHGKPRPWDLILPDGARWGTRHRFGTKPVDWVRDYYAEILQAGEPSSSPQR